MTVFSDPLFVACVVIAAILVGFSKSGLMVSIGALNVPMLTLVMPARDAAGALLPVMIAVDVIALFYYLRYADWHLLWVMLPGSMLGIAVGWLLSSAVDEHSVRLAIGVVTLIFVLDAYLPLRKKLASLPPSRFWGTFWGAISGFTSFMSHTGGPPYQIYALPQRQAPVVFAGTAAVFFAITNVAKLIPYYFLGQLEANNLLLSAIMTPIALVSMALGFYLLKRMSPKAFYHLAYGLLFLFSLKLIWDGLSGLFA